jgi:hypothetical protein
MSPLIPRHEERSSAFAGLERVMFEAADPRCLWFVHQRTTAGGQPYQLRLVVGSPSIIYPRRSYGITGPH